MIVEKLIEVLRTYDPGMEVVVSQHNVFGQTLLMEHHILEDEDGRLWFDVPLPDYDNEEDYE